MHSREEYVGLRRLKHESNKKFLGMSSKVPPFALYPDKLAPSSRDAKPDPQSKKKGRLRLRKRCTIFCKDATIAQKKTNRKQSSKIPFLLDTFVTSAMNGITISDCQEHTHTHTQRF